VLVVLDMKRDTFYSHTGGLKFSMILKDSGVVVKLFPCDHEILVSSGRTLFQIVNGSYLHLVAHKRFQTSTYVHYRELSEETIYL
jgi:hypothetical protein